MSGSSKKIEAIEQRLTERGVTFQGMGQAGERSILISVEKADCLIEVGGDNKISCQFGVDMEELRTLLSGGTTEDIASDELQRVARDHLRPSFQKYRPKLSEKGFEETVDATEEYYAISFVKSVDLSDPDAVVTQLQDCLNLLS